MWYWNENEKKVKENEKKETIPQVLSVTWSAMISINATSNGKTKLQNETVASRLVESAKQFLLSEPFLVCPVGCLRATRAIPASQLRWSPIDPPPFSSRRTPWIDHDHRCTLVSYLRWSRYGCRIHIPQPDARQVDNEQQRLRINKTKCIQCNISVDFYLTYHQHEIHRRIETGHHKVFSILHYTNG